MSLAYRLPRAAQPSYVSLVGPRQSAFEVPVHPGDRFAGVRFWPDRGGAFLGVDPAHLRDHLGPAEALRIPAALLSSAPYSACQDIDAVLAVFAALVQARAGDTPPLDPVVRAGVMAIINAQGRTPIARLAADAGLGERQFQRRFRRAVGLTPKQFARIRRLRSAGGRLLEGPPRWAALAADAGFADQPHLIREFQLLTGLTPEGFLSRLRTVDHVDVRP